MKWSKAAWKEIFSATISNCFRHTGLWATAPLEPPDEEEASIEQGLQEDIDRLAPYCPMSLANLLNPVEENDGLHHEFTDEELVELAQADPEEVEEEDLASSVPLVSEKEKLSLSGTIELLDLDKEQHRMAYRVLRELQNSIRHSQKTQTTLDSWFL
jgi:hypothetical protein